MPPLTGSDGLVRARSARPLYELLADQVRQQVGSGELRPGERLPGEHELALSLGVSRPSVRESLKILQALGIVKVRHGAGIFVTAADPADIVRRLTPSPTLPPAELQQVFQVRKVLECQAAAWAAERISGAETVAIAATVAEMQSLAESPLAADGAPLDSLAALDGVFHSQLTVATRNAVLIGLMDNMMETIKESRRYSLGIPGRAILSVFDHKRVFDAVAAHDAVLAARSMYAHLDGVEHAVFRARPDAGDLGSGLVVVSAVRRQSGAVRQQASG